MPGLLDLSPGTPEWAAAQHFYPQPMIYPSWNRKAWEYAFSRMPASENIESSVKNSEAIEWAESPGPLK
jgi:hypothetical protein